MKRNSIITLIFSMCVLLVFSCSPSSNVIDGDFEVMLTNGKSRKFIPVTDSGLKAFVFISPDCPLCINYTSTITNLNDKFKHNQLRILVVYPGNFYSIDEITTFEKDYNFHFEGILDKTNKVTKLLNATTTPQVVLLNLKNEIIYSGAIDNRAVAPGKKRQKITENYLENAITNAIKGRKPEPTKTEAIGCFIEM